ncbi:MAG: helix-turn-helix transcriptional regulator [Oscillospiraceae bacterium]|nr:helix-turn-helix transcriptional regulator [Oscillospiraceae bacterium]
MMQEDVFLDAKAFLEQHLDSNVTADELARHLCVSKATLFRIFQKYAGCGVHRCFLKLRIEKATQLLQQGMSVSQTAERLGFGSPGYFSDRYKRETGISPSKVQKK